MMFYDRYGEPTTFDGYAKELPRKRLRQTFVRHYMVSTVYIGIDLSAFVGPPVIFETMIFDMHRGPLDLECQRYSTLTAAHLGHVDILSMVLHLIGAEWSDIHLDIDSRPALTTRWEEVSQAVLECSQLQGFPQAGRAVYGS